MCVLYYAGLCQPERCHPVKERGYSLLCHTCETAPELLDTGQKETGVKPTVGHVGQGGAHVYQEKLQDLAPISIVLFCFCFGIRYYSGIP